MTTLTIARTAVALNADVVGYSRLLADDRAKTSETMAAYRELVEERVLSFGGTVANFVGDNFMAIFDDSKDAVQAAIEITTEVEARNADVEPAKQVRFRMGIDVGDVVDAGADVEGEALNVAARIQAKALPGGLSVSGAVYRALDEPALRFRPTGEHRLKNIPEPVDIYQYVDLPSDGVRPAGHGTLSLESPSVAVLPIHSESVDDDVRAVAGIVRGNLLHRLSALRQLTVVDTNSRPGEGTAAAARYMLETGIYQYGDHLRIFATLFDVTTMNVVKSLKWSTTRAEVLAMSDDIAEEVARSIEIDLVVGAPAGLYAELDDPMAIEKVYLGWYHMRSDTREGWNEALRLFGEVAESHPDQAYGYVLQAYALWIGAASQWTPDPIAALQQARQLASKGAEVGDPTGMAKAVEAAALMSLGRVDDAVKAIDQLEIVRPTCDVTYALEGSLRRYLGQWEEAVDLLDVAMRLTGVNKPWYPTVKACSLFIGSKLEQAASIVETVLEFQPNNLEALLVLAAAQHEMGMARRAQATADEIRNRFPSTDIGAWIDRSSYQDEAIVQRWRGDLVALGLID